MVRTMKPVWPPPSAISDDASDCGACMMASTQPSRRAAPTTNRTMPETMAVWTIFAHRSATVRDRYTGPARSSA